MTARASVSTYAAALKAAHDAADASNVGPRRFSNPAYCATIDALITRNGLFENSVLDIVALVEAAQEALDLWPPTFHPPSNLRDALDALNARVPQTLRRV